VRAGPRRAVLEPPTSPITSSSRQANQAGFKSFRLDAQIERGIQAAGFETPRPIQAETLPDALEGRDILGLAQTGTGKTAAFVLPILDMLLERGGRGPRALIVAPTRELALQIHAEIEVLAKFTNVTSVTVFGGVGINPQVRALAKNPDIIVACPGRLLDLYRQRAINLDRVEMLVLDEADHMFDMGFLPDIRRIMEALPRDRQNLLFSATMPREIRKLADRILYQPHVVELEHSTPINTIQHVVQHVSQSEKVDLLQQILKGEDFRSAIVFLRTKHRARRLAEQLSRWGFNAVALQGNMSQGQRTRAMQGFREGRFEILVATDIAARGIDVAAVSHVINFDLPNTPDAYTHRIGRTGRAELNGKAVTFVTPDDHSELRAIERNLGQKIDVERVDGLEVRKRDSVFGRSGGGGGARRGSGRGGSRAGGSRAGGGGQGAGKKRAGTKGARKRSRRRAS
jgi:ATP-dependent RNA helicase RhlE